MTNSAAAEVVVVGGGLAGAEAAWQALQAGARVTLYEMRPARPTPVHQTDRFAELVCSNSLKSNLLTNAAGLLKEEMRRMGSLIVAAADASQVPAGEALAVDREIFAREITGRLEEHPNLTVRREEFARPLAAPNDPPTIIATGPLTSDALAAEIGRVTGTGELFFYDAVAPTIDATTINREKVFVQSRYDKGDAAYLNCPFSRDEYEAFYDALLHAELAPVHEHEAGTPYFEGCLPIEVLASRGPKTLAYGPMKPVGLTDPRTGRRPWAVVQLRQENLAATLYSMVGFQTRMKWGEQKRVFRMIPGLEEAEFVRYGVIHRNTYLRSPDLLTTTLQMRAPEPALRGTDHRRGGLCRVSCVRYTRRSKRRRDRPGPRTAHPAEHDYARRAGGLRQQLLRQGLPADELQLGHRPAAGQPAARQARKSAHLCRARTSCARAILGDRQTVVDTTSKRVIKRRPYDCESKRKSKADIGGRALLIIFPFGTAPSPAASVSTPFPVPLPSLLDQSPASVARRMHGFHLVDDHVDQNTAHRMQIWRVRSVDIKIDYEIAGGKSANVTAEKTSGNPLGFTHSQSRTLLHWFGIDIAGKPNITYPTALVWTRYNGERDARIDFMKGKDLATEVSIDLAPHR